jgi:NAD(P)H dehydrogenase (quinone)
VYKNAIHHVVKHGTLKFSGVNPAKVTEICPIKTSTDKQREKWLADVEALGRKQA